MRTGTASNRNKLHSTRVHLMCISGPKYPPNSTINGSGILFIKEFHSSFRGRVTTRNHLWMGRSSHHRTEVLGTVPTVAQVPSSTRGPPGHEHHPSSPLDPAPSEGSKGLPFFDPRSHGQPCFLRSRLSGQLDSTRRLSRGSGVRAEAAQVSFQFT